MNLTLHHIIQLHFQQIHPQWNNVKIFLLSCASSKLIDLNKIKLYLIKLIPYNIEFVLAILFCYRISLCSFFSSWLLLGFLVQEPGSRFLDYNYACTIHRRTRIEKKSIYIFKIYSFLRNRKMVPYIQHHLTLIAMHKGVPVCNSLFNTNLIFSQKEGSGIKW